MRHIFISLLFISLCACSRSDQPPVVITAATALVEVDEDFDGGEEPDDAAEPAAPEIATISVSEMLSNIRLGRHVTSSRRMLRLQITPVQRAPHSHGAAVVRSWPESRIINSDPTIANHTELLELTVLVLARIAISEAAWDFTADMPAIYQVIRRNRGDTETLINAMRNHSRIVSEVWAPSREREQWLAELNLDLTRPEHFPVELDEHVWEVRYREQWAAAIHMARALIEDRIDGTPCPVQVVAWGGRCDDEAGACDDHRAIRRGLVPVESCGRTANRFWTFTRYMTPVLAHEEVALTTRLGIATDERVVAIATGEAVVN